MDANITVNKQRVDAVLFIQMGKKCSRKGERSHMYPTLMVEERIREKIVNRKITKMFSRYIVWEPSKYR